MKFTKLYTEGACLIEPEPIKDTRGFFSRVYCEDELIAHGLSPVGVQCNNSYNYKKGTLRGMHYQLEPYQEDKLVRCTRGKIWDVFVDLRKDSNTYCTYLGFELSADNRFMLYIPKGFAHGYQTLEDETEVFYQVSQKYTKGAEQGVRFNDKAFGILWPVKITEISDRDLSHPDFKK